MTTINQRLTFFCPRHRELCTATRATPEIICEQGPHALSENFLRDKWHFCCGCQSFFPRADNQPANKACPLCSRPATWRYLCDGCQVLSFETAEPPRHKEFALGPAGTPQPACPGCLRAAKPQLHEHQCPILGDGFKTARPVCPFCGDHLTAPQRTNYDFPHTYRKPLAEYLQNMHQGAFRADLAAATPNALSAVSHGRFVLTQFRDEQTFIVFPDVREFAFAQDYQPWQNVFDCGQPRAGEVWLVAPAVAILDSLTHEYFITQKGKLEVQAKATAPWAEQIIPDLLPSPVIPVKPPLPQENPTSARTAPATPVTAKPPFSRPSTLTADEAAAGQKRTSTSKPPLPLLIASGAAVLLLLVFMLYYAFNSTKRTIIAKAKQGQIVTPSGDSAYDLFMKGGLSESDLAEIRREVAPVLESRGNEVIRQLVNDGYNPPANELSDTAKLFGWFNQLAPSNSSQARERYFQGRAAYERQDWNGAENEFRQALTLDPSWALPVNTLARVFMRRKDYATARTCYENAIQLDQTWIFPRINLCVLANEQLKDYPLGEQTCRDVLQLDPNKAAAYYYLGRALEGRNNRCGAYEQYRLAAEKAANTTNPGFNVNRLNSIINRLASQCGGR